MYNGIISQYMASEPNFLSASGILIDRSSIGNDGCNMLYKIKTATNNVVTFVISPKTYFIGEHPANIGNEIKLFYPANAPAPAIYPPRFTATVGIIGNPPYEIKVDFFDHSLLSQDKQLKLNIHPQTLIELENGQTFLKSIQNHNLIVFYTYTTRSIPAQTSPQKIVVLCQ